MGKIEYIISFNTANQINQLKFFTNKNLLTGDYISFADHNDAAALLLKFGTHNFIVTNRLYSIAYDEMHIFVEPKYNNISVI